MTLSRFIDELDATDRTLAVVNRSSPRPIQSMLEGLFDDQPVGVEERSVPDGEGDLVVLIEDGSVVASSPLSALYETVLAVNSDLFRTGTRTLETVELPDVIANLDDVPFRLRGYPESDREKLLLIVVSRAFERIAWEAGEGTLRASFQRLSRIEDERGTRAVYERLADTDLDVHVYGRPDWTPPPGSPLTMHGGYGGDFRDSWFVVYTPPGGDPPETTGGAGRTDGEYAALVAVEVAPREWEGFWTYRPSLVSSVNRSVERRL